jgi:hemoglobin
VSEALYTRLGRHEGILRLLHPFYADVRQHAVLGPIFNARIHDWPAHLAKIAEFWARQTGGPSAYSGGFAAAHLSLGIGTEHFTHWLRLWDINCQRNLADAESREMSALAHTLAERLQSIVAGQGRQGGLVQRPGNQTGSNHS